MEKICTKCSKKFNAMSFKRKICSACKQGRVPRNSRWAGRRKKTVNKAVRNALLTYALDGVKSIEWKWCNESVGYEGKITIPSICPQKFRFSVHRAQKRSQLVFKIGVNNCDVRVEGRCMRQWSESRFKSDRKGTRPVKKSYTKYGVCACVVCEAVNYLNERLQEG